MQYEQIEKENWNSYFDLLSKMARGRQVLLERIGHVTGDQIIENWIFFNGATYDSAKETLYVHTRYLEHAILRPRDIIAQRDGNLKSISIRDSDGAIEIIHFRDPLLLQS